MESGLALGFSGAQAALFGPWALGWGTPTLGYPGSGSPGTRTRDQVPGTRDLGPGSRDRLTGTLPG